jgi:probable HAF family extracellular repeat protein
MVSRAVLCRTPIILCCLLAVAVGLAAQTSYTIVPLGTLGGLSGGGSGINDRRWVTGSANQAGDTVSHAALWMGGPQVIDLGALGGPGINSTVAWPVKSNNGVVVGISDTDEDQQPADNFSCYPFFATGSPTGKICKGFRWANGAMTALPPFPGGFNSYATAVNNRGEIVGWAENGVADPTCNTGVQTLQFRAVIWEPDGAMKELPPLPGDSTSAATAINDLGQVVGISGACGIAVGGVSAAHSVLWQNGVPINIGDLGGHTWNTPTAINNVGTVVGFSLPAGQDGTRNFEAFLWTQATGIQRLGKLPGDIRAEALGVNEKNQVVGLSRGGPFLFRAFIWQNGVMSDLNTMTVAGSPFLLYANDINDRGEITGEAFDPNTLAAPAFLGIPVFGGAGAAGQAVVNESPTVILPGDVRKHLQQRVGFGLPPSDLDEK